MNIEKIFEEAINDPELLSTIDVEKLLDSLENDKNDYLENKTIKKITKEIFNKVNELDIEKEKKMNYCEKLNEYRLVNEINELHKGKHIKWIKLINNQLIGGGIVVNIKFTDNGTNILVKNQLNRFIQIKMDDCLIFQKMTLQEQLILMAYEYIDKKK
jgi:hypothetical protein